MRERDRAAERVADHMRLVDPERVQKADRLRDPRSLRYATSFGRSEKPNPTMSGAMIR